LKLKVVEDMRDHPLKKMLDAGLCVTINSDDPAYFGGYMNTNWEATFAALDLTTADATLLAKNSFEAAFVDEGTRAGYLARLDAFMQGSAQRAKPI
jgi:adenosine deaminase